ncbi:MAG: SDR family oxidoreductase [Schleiferiaceae bacterium]
MKNTVVIGGGSGIGKATVEQLLNEGHQVFATYNNTPIDIHHANLETAKFNVLEDEFPTEFLPDTIDALMYGPGKIDLKPFHRIPLENFIDDYQLQVGGAIKTLQACFSKLKKGTDPSVVLFSTVAVQNGFPFHAQVASSKGAIEGITRSLAAEWAPTIRVNAIAPSLTHTPIADRLLSSEEKIQANADRHPLKKIGSAENLAKTAVFLLTDASEWMTGQVLGVDGGKSSIAS